MKILLTCIFKNDTEYLEIERMLKSFMPYAQGLCVVITAEKADKLKSLIKSYNGQYLHLRPQDYPQIYTKEGDKYVFTSFKEARNVCFTLASQMQKKEKYDWWTWADSDDVLLNGQELETVAKKALEFKVDMVFFTYWYSINIKDGKFSEKDVQVDHLRERLIKPNMFKWVSKLHEICLPIDGNYKPTNTVYDYNQKEGRGIVWAHITDNERVLAAMERNIKILELQAKEEQHKDPRTIFYLAKSYFDMDKKELYQLSDLLLNEYLELSGWAEERASAWEYKGNIRAKTDNHRGAIECYHNAIKEYGNRPMPFLLLAKEYAEVNDNEQSEFWLETALKLDAPGTRTTIGNPLELKFMSSSLKFNQAIRKQNIDEAIYWLKIRNELEGVKEDPMLTTLEETKLLNQAAMWVFNYSKWLKDSGHQDKLPYIIKSLPLDLGREPFAHIISNEYALPRTWEKNEIAYYASFGQEHFEQWSGKSLAKGIGGSETAVIELARKWVAKGWKVTVFGDPREDEGEIDGVTYRPWYECNWKDKFNILILWRSPHLLDRDIKAKKLFMDLHDVSSQLDWTDERMKKVDKVFFKSNYQRSMLPKLFDEKAVIISNGI